jgi:prepilin-type processing-associated H-X9-DG protein
MMLAEEPTTKKPGEMPPGNSAIIDDGQWDPYGNPALYSIVGTLTMRHSGKAEVQYGDGHATAVSYKQAEDPSAILAAF